MRVKLVDGRVQVGRVVHVGIEMEVRLVMSHLLLLRMVHRALVLVSVVRRTGAAPASAPTATGSQIDV